MNLRRLSAVSFGHMAIDILNASIAMILAVLAVPFNITNAQIGLGGMAYALMGSLSQPFFGVLADRFGGRWLGAAGLLWTAVFYYAATFSQDYFTLITLMTVASLGSGAFHPQGAMNAGAAGGPKATTGTSVFFLLGQMGLAIGPMIAGILLEEVWMLGPRIMAIATLPFVVWMAISLRKPLVRVEEEPPRPLTAEQRARLQRQMQRAANAPRRVPQPNRRWVAIAAFAVLVALRASVHQIFYGMLPKYFADLGFTPTQFGFMVGVPSVAIALGSMAGGVLGDRYDQPKILLWSLLASTPFSWLMLDLVDGWVFFPAGLYCRLPCGDPAQYSGCDGAAIFASQAGAGQRRYSWVHIYYGSAGHGGGRSDRGLLHAFRGYARGRSDAIGRGVLRRVFAYAHCDGVAGGAGGGVGGLRVVPCQGALDYEEHLYIREETRRGAKNTKGVSCFLC